MSGCELYTADEIGRALDKTRFAIRRALNGIEPAGKKNVSNNLAAAWSFDQFPLEIRAELRGIQERRRYRCELDVLRDPPRRYRSPALLSDIDPAEIVKAQKLQRAFAAALALPVGHAAPEQAAIALRGYWEVFGHEASERAVSGLLERAMQRDAGMREFHRLDLYLPDAPRLKREAAKAAKPSADFADLEVAFSAVQDQTAPTSEELSYCWRQVAMTFEETSASASAPRLKRDLITFLVGAAPFLAPTAEAMKRQLNRKLAAASEAGVAALCDGRTGRQANSPETKELHRWKADVEMFAEWTARRQGRQSQAYRELWLGTHPTGKQFSAPFRERFPFDVREEKSRVPTLIRNLVNPIIKANEDRLKGPKQAQARKPSHHRDWSNTAAGDVHTADDFTPDHLWFEWSEEGQYEFDGRRFNVGRGQLILFTDERTDLPLYFDLSLSQQPNSRMVFTSLSRMWTDEGIGLPAVGANFERNIFESLKVKSLFTWPKLDASFARAGIKLRLRNQTTAKSKVIERVGGQLHNRLNHLPSYVGRDEQHIRHERIQAFSQRLKRVGQPRKDEVNPCDMLLSKEEFAEHTLRALDAFADEPQNGSRLNGLSPREAWKAMLPKTPRRLLPESLHYLICSEKAERTVSHEGVWIPRVGGGKNWYYGSERLGALRGEKVELYFNPQIPEHVTIIHRQSDPGGVNPFSVPLAPMTPANSATAEDFANVKRQQKAFAARADSTRRIIRPPSTLTIRDELLGPRELRETGERISAVSREQIEISQEKSRLVSKLRKLAGAENLHIDLSRVKTPEDARESIESLERAVELREQIEEIEAEENLNPDSKGRTYQLPERTLPRKQREAIYWNLRREMKEITPDGQWAAVTRRTLGSVPAVTEMTDEQLGKMIEVFAAIIRDVAAK